MNSSLCSFLHAFVLLRCRCSQHSLSQSSDLLIILHAEIWWISTVKLTHRSGSVVPKLWFTTHCCCPIWLEWWQECRVLWNTVQPPPTVISWRMGTTCRRNFVTRWKLQVTAIAHSTGIQGLSKRSERFTFGIFYVLIVKIRYNFTHK